MTQAPVPVAPVQPTLNLSGYFPMYHKEYEGKIRWEAWYDCITQANKLIARSLELFAAYWRSGDEILFDMANRLLEQAYDKLALLRLIVNKEDAEQMSCLQTYLYNLAGCMGFKDNNADFQR